MKISATYKGLIAGLTMIAVSLILFYGLHLPLKGNSSYAVMGIFELGVLWPLISLKINSPEGKSFKDYFSEGFKSFIVMTLLIVLYTVVIYKLNPQILETILKENAVAAAGVGNRTPAEIEENTRKLKDIFMPMTMATTTVLYLLMGSVISLIGSFVLSQPNKS